VGNLKLLGQLHVAIATAHRISCVHGRPAVEIPGERRCSIVVHAAWAKAVPAESSRPACQCGPSGQGLERPTGGGKSKLRLCGCSDGLE